MREPGSRDVAQDARDVADEHERLGVERDRDAVGDDVRVDVEHARRARRRPRHASDRHVARAREQLDELAVHARRRRRPDRSRSDPGPRPATTRGGRFVARTASALAPWRPTGFAPAASERRARVDVHLAGDDHLDDLERVGVGDAPAGDDLRRLPEPLLQRRRLRAAAVHDDDALAARLHLARRPRRSPPCAGDATTSPPSLMTT